MATNTETNELRVYGVGSDGRPHVEYKHIRSSATHTEATHRPLPPELAVLVGDDGRVSVSDLTDDERAWVDAELTEGLLA
jgi:hypothetical protein